MIPYSKRKFSIDNKTKIMTNKALIRLVSNKISKTSTLDLLFAKRSIVKEKVVL
jgi:hypothetical protein